MNGPNLDAWIPRIRSIYRIVVAFLFTAHGTQKLLTFPVAAPRDPAPLLSLTGVGGILEMFGGLLLLFGLFTRPVAFILCGQMAVAYFLRHSPNGFWPILNRGELAVLYCFTFLYLAAVGGGAWSMDAVLRRRRRGPERRPVR
ncbi:MAG: DoxX family protein [Candidatus Eisenbacteria bacterium]|nr:DoxX family protein [Candidatus Eisenbacteria bacterium]